MNVSLQIIRTGTEPARPAHLMSRVTEAKLLGGRRLPRWAAWFSAALQPPASRWAAA
jgi:hypothetical protein